ncbi:alpha/beta fold hydrolase [Shigella flexneri]
MAKPGRRDCHLVLLHGWGLNAHRSGIALRRESARVLAASGRPAGLWPQRWVGALSLEEMAEHVLEKAPVKAIWLGWSLGGLVASEVALRHPERVEAFVTVASSLALARMTRSRH